MKQQDIERATGEQAQTIEELKSKREKYVRTNIGTRSKVSRSKGHTKEIQLCLKNAGFYDGEIDGIKGKGTRKAIREFQEAKGLTSDGVVGPRTWKLLSKYASGAAQDSAGTEEEGTK